VSGAGLRVSACSASAFDASVADLSGALRLDDLEQLEDVYVAARVVA
jgi:hypothetical protein